MKAKRITLTKPQIADILRRLDGRETQVDIAKDFGVTRSAISLIKQRTADPERFKKLYQPKKQLTPAEQEEFCRALHQTRPADHGLQSAPPHPANEWSLPSSYALADKLFSRVPSVRVMKECLAKLAPPSTTRHRPKRRSRRRPTRA